MSTWGSAPNTRLVVLPRRRLLSAMRLSRSSSYSQTAAMSE